MPTTAEHLATARANYAQQLAELSDPAKRKPSYSIGGRSVDWVRYQEFLLSMMEKLDSQIAAEDSALTITAIG